MLQQLLGNHLLWTALLANLVAQAFKLALFYARSRKMDWRILFQTGGMPSSHSALVSALACGVGLQEGWDSVVFAITTVFAVIVMYDAAGVRQAAGKQATVLNQMIGELFDEEHQMSEVQLKELLGHTPIQVLVGSVLGVLWSLLALLYIWPS